MGLQLPDAVPDSARNSIQAGGEEESVLALWEAGELSTRRAAEELGLTYRGFLDLLASKSIPAESGPLKLEAIEKAEEKLSGNQL